MNTKKNSKVILNRLTRRNFLRYSGFLFTGSVFLPAVDYASAEATSAVMTDAVTDTVPKATHTISCWGDSLTAGSGGKPYATMLQQALPQRKVNFYAISGQQAYQIAARQGGLPVKLTLENDAFHGADPVKVTAINYKFLSTGSNNNVYKSKGTINDIACEVTRTVEVSAAGAKTEVYMIQPLEATTASVPAKSTFILEDSITTKSDTQIYWMGRINTPNFSQLISDIDSCIAHLADKSRFAVIGVLSGADEFAGSKNYDAIKAINAQLAEKYKDNYIVSTPPTKAEMKAIHFTPDDTEKEEIAAGAFPKGMRADMVHLNNKGYQIIANRVLAFLKKHPNF